MRQSALCLTLSALLMFVLIGCGDDAGDTEKSTEDSAGDGLDSDDDTDTGDTETEDGDSDHEPGETDSDEDDNAPPDLPERCVLVTEVVGGEDVGDFPMSGQGDARYIDMAVDLETGDGVAVWGYFGSAGGGDTPSRWGIQSVPYWVDQSVEDVSYTRHLGETLDVTTAEESHLAEMPAIVKGRDGYAVVYRDARWDETCNPLEYEDCGRDVAFIQLDADGVPTDREPIRLSDSARVSHRPAIAATPDGGYIVAWRERESEGYKVRTARLGTDGAPGEIFTLPGGADNFDGPSVASNDSVAVVVYATEDKESIAANVWPHGDSGPLARTDVISDEHTLQRSPKIAAGDDGFMVSWNGELALQYEIFLRPLDASGEVSGDIQRGTWCVDAVSGSDVAWNGESFGLVWAASKANGSDECAVEASSCKQQVFAALVEADGVVASEPVMFSNDPNQSQNATILWDGIGWTAVWQTWGNLRWRAFYGQMVCE